MCGRFTITVDRETIQRAFPWLEVQAQITPRFNVAPTQPIAVIPNDGENKLDFFVWGLIPSWAKDPKMGSRMINARSETLAKKPSFRAAYRRRRCLILADGFYEWQKVPGEKTKIPHYIKMKSDQPFGIAGLWEIWNAPDGSVIKSTTIITTQPNDLVAQVHNRMPVILKPEAYEHWLSTEEQNPEALNGYLGPYPAEEMKSFPVSRLVNSPQNDVPDCIVPAN